MSEFGGGSYLTVKIGIISTTIPALLLFARVQPSLCLILQLLLSFVLWHYAWDHVYPARPDARRGKRLFKEPFPLFFIHVLATVLAPYLPLLVATTQLDLTFGEWL